MEAKAWTIYAAKLKNQDIAYSSSASIVPIVVGAHDLQDEERIQMRNSGHAFDDEGENISSLNPFFAEFTSVYWLLKNCKDKEYIGNAHYRRKWNDEDLINSENNVLYVSDSCYFIYNLAEQFMGSHSGFNAPAMTIDLAERGLIPFSANQMKTLWTQNIFHGYQMARGPTTYYKSFMNLAFDCIWPFWEEHKEEIKTIDGYNRRMIGFLGERMITGLILYRDHFFDFPILTSRVEVFT